MKRYLVWICFFGALTIAPFAQESAATIAARQEAAERERLIRGDLEDARQANVRMQTQINNILNDYNALQRQLSEMENRFRTAQANAITRKDLEKIVESLKKVDDNRIADRNLLIEQIKEVARIAAARPPQVVVEPRHTPPPTSSARTTPLDNGNGREKPDEDVEPVRDNPLGYYTYKIKSSDTLTAIISAYNVEMKAQNKMPITMDQVKKANPKLNPNRMVVGKEIQIPIPPDK